jgi:hypothetical protein
MVSRERMEESLTGSASGLASKAELARQHGISRQSLHRCIWDGPPRLVALAIFGLWYQDRMEIVRRTERTGRRDDVRTRGHAGKSWPEKLIFCCNCNYTIHTLIQNLLKKQQKSLFLNDHREPRRNMSAWTLDGNATLNLARANIGSRF